MRPLRPRWTPTPNSEASTQAVGQGIDDLSDRKPRLLSPEQVLTINTRTLEPKPETLNPKQAAANSDHQVLSARSSIRDH